MDIIKYFLLLAAFLLLDRFMTRKFPRFWKTLDLLANILLTSFSLLFICIQLSALKSTISSSVSTGDKVFLSIIILSAIAAFIGLNVITWNRWRKDRKHTNTAP